MEHQEQITLLRGPLQQAYDLTFNPKLRGGAKGPDWRKLNQNVTLFPNGLDITINAVTKSIKWELIDGQVSNITYVDVLFFNVALHEIQYYLKHTE